MLTRTKTHRSWAKVQDTIRKKSSRTADDDGFSLIEVVVVMVIIGALGLIGFMAYTSIIGDARGTALDANITTAAEALQLEAGLEPTIINTDGELIQRMTERTNFAWDGTWNSTTTDTVDTIRFERIEDHNNATPTPRHPTSGQRLRVAWLLGTNTSTPDYTNAAVRLHLRNPEGEWRCALIVLKTASAASDSVAAPGTTAAARVKGLWYDGGDAQADSGLHDCSPLPTTITAVEYPDSATDWSIPTVTTQLDPTSTDTPGSRTLHRSTSTLDSPS